MTKYSIKYLILLAAGLILVFTTGCDKREEVTQEQIEDQRPQWDWSHYDRSTELILGTKRVFIQPKLSVEIRANTSGTLTLLVDKPLLSVVKDFMFAQMNKEKLANESEKLEIGKRKRKLEGMKEKEFNRPQQLKEAKERLDEAREHLARIEKIMKSKSVRKEAVKWFGEKYADVGEKQLREAKDELSLAERQYAMAEEVDRVLFVDQDRLSELEESESEKQLEEKLEKAQYTVPFSGELRIELEDYIQGVSEYAVTGRQVIATVNDYDAMHVLLSVLGESWVRLEPNTLFLKLDDRNKTIVEFKESKVVKNASTRREEKTYVFAISTADQPNLRRLSGTAVEAQLITNLPKRAWIVPKVDIAMEALGKTSSKVWAEIVDDIWTGAVLLAEGENSLAIDYTPQLAPKSWKDDESPKPNNPSSK